VAGSLPDQIAVFRVSQIFVDLYFIINTIYSKYLNLTHKM